MRSADRGAGRERIRGLRFPGAGAEIGVMLPFDPEDEHDSDNSGGSTGGW